MNKTSQPPPNGTNDGRITGAPAISRKPEELARAVAERLEINKKNTAANHDAEPMAEWSAVNEGRVSESDVLQIYSDVSDLEVIEDDAFQGVQAIPGVSFEFLEFHGCLPLRHDGDQIILAVTNPYWLGIIASQWENLFGESPQFVLGRRSLIEQRLNSLYAQDHDHSEAAHESGEPTEETLRDLAREAPVVRLVNDIFDRAVEMGASDIHVEPSEDELAVRYRIDGMLHTVMTPPLSYYAAVASRLKLTAGMNIAERRLPQDGRTNLTVAGRQIDVRVSTVPTMQGESIVLRLLEKEAALLDLDSVGLEDQMLERFKTLVQKPYGMVLVVGPTGSGKTTTLYSVMKLLNSDERKIITIEDPVEYQVRGLAQIQVRPQIGLTFANGLRSIVRQDPDIILVGEIRDRETAEIAVHAALTGHLVFSTLHTNDAAGAVSRLLDMGIEGFLIASALLGVAAQRLVRTLCPNCRGTGKLDGQSADSTTCRTCRGTGYKGRVGVFELLVVDDALRAAINQRCDSSELARLARTGGMQTLLENGKLKVRQGITTTAEIARVCQMDDEG